MTSHFVETLRREAIYASLFLAILGGAMEPRALAEEPDTDPPGYRELVDDGLSEYRAGNFAEARALFGRAHAIAPSARTLRGMAMAAFELRHYAECLRHIEAALSSDVKPLSGPLRGEADALRSRALHFVDRVALEVDPSRAQVALDGVPVSAAGSGRYTLSLDIGEHLIEATAPGYLPERRPLRVAGGESSTVRIELAAQPDLASAPAQGAPASDSSAPSEPRRWYKSPWLWSAAAVVVVGAAATAGVLATRDSTQTAGAFTGSVPNTAGP